MRVILMNEADIRARQHLADVLRHITENTEPPNFDEIGEAAYAALFQLGVTETSGDENILRTANEISSLQRVIDGLDQMFNVIGNCPDEEHNLKRIVWGDVATHAQAAYEILTTQT
jgi:hypothetical protein